MWLVLCRCRALYRPVGSAHGFTKKETKRIICAIWVVAFLITSPWLFVFNVVQSTDQLDYGIWYCQEDWPDQLYGNVYFVAVHLVLCFAFPLFLISVLNFLIWWNMRKFQRVSMEQQLPLRYNFTGVTKLLFIISLSFIVCWMPLYVLVAKIKLFTVDANKIGDDSILQVLIPVSQLMGTCNSCINPILYAFYSRRFREYVLSCCENCYS